MWVLAYVCGILWPHSFRIRVVTQNKETIQSWTRPTSPTDSRRFFGLIGLAIIVDLLRGFHLCHLLWPSLLRRQLSFNGFKLPIKASGIEKEVDYCPNFNLTRRYSVFFGAVWCILSWVGLCVNAKCQGCILCLHTV